MGGVPVRLICATWLVGFVTVAGAVAAAGGAGDSLTLVEAAKHKDKEAVRTLLKQGAKVNAPQADGATALHWAAHWDDLEMADLLLKAGANVKAANDHGATPLWVACVGGSPAMIEKLLNAGADANAGLPTGETPLMTAARSGHVLAVKLLLAHGADVNAVEKLRGQTALMWAASQQHPDVVQTLLELGATVTARSQSRRELVNTTGNADYSGVIEVEQGGYTPLLFAARQGDVASGKLLVDHGANVNDAAPSGTSVLLVAAHSGHAEFAKFLLDKGADPNAMSAGYAPLHIATQRGDLELVNALLAHGANPNAILLQGSPARRVSADVTIMQTGVGATPLWLAASLGRADIMKALAAKGANPSIDKDGTTALMAAIGNNERRSAEAVKVLLEIGADVNAPDQEGKTALFTAAARGYVSIIQMLADKGAKVDVRNRKGQTALRFAMNEPREGGRGGPIDRTAALDLLRKLGASD
jgi:ankyrin repeat protein